MYKEYKLNAKGIRSLCWDGNSLVDWVAGGTRYDLDGQSTERRVNYSYPFTSAIVSPSGVYAAIFTKNQTKGLILKNGHIFREINRSYYCAHAYDYPVTFCRLKDGREVIIHCPNEYCQLEIEEIETGKILTDSSLRESADFFHSRLSTSPNGKWLLSAGWIWHPVHFVGLYNVEDALNNPGELDRSHGFAPDSNYEIISAAFLNNDKIYVSTSDECFDHELKIEESHPQSFSMALWSIKENKFIKSIECGQPVGELLPISDRYVVSFYRHPRLWDMKSGNLINEWNDLDSGKQNGSITQGKEFPPLAIDIQNKRFAVWNDDETTVIEF